jgi:hypothetical protein
MAKQPTEVPADYEPEENQNPNPHESDDSYFGGEADFGGADFGPKYPYVSSIHAGSSIAFALLTGAPVDTYWQDGTDSERLRGRAGEESGWAKHDIFPVYIPDGRNANGEPLQTPENGTRNVAKLDVKGFLRGELARVRAKVGTLYNVKRSGTGKKTRYEITAVPNVPANVKAAIRNAFDEVSGQYGG